MPVAVGQECRRLDFLTEPPVVAVLAAFQFAEDDSALGIDLVGQEDRIGHAVAFDLQGQFESIRRERLEVGGPILAGHAVEQAAGPGHGLVEGSLWELFCPLEEHMFDPMADAGVAGPLVAAADAVEDPEAGHRRLVGLMQQHLKAVV